MADKEEKILENTFDKYKEGMERLIEEKKGTTKSEIESSGLVARDKKLEGKLEAYNEIKEELENIRGWALVTYNINKDLNQLAETKDFLKIMKYFFFLLSMGAIAIAFFLFLFSHGYLT